MELTLVNHDSRYQVEQLQQALFGVDASGQAVSSVLREDDAVVFSTQITVDGKTESGIRRLTPAQSEDKRLFYRALRQSYFDAALGHLPHYPVWGALSGVRPTKLTTAHLLQGGTAESAEALMQQQYYVTPERAKMAVACSLASVRAVEQTQRHDLSLYIGIPFCPTRCSYCSFVSRTAGKKTALLDEYVCCLLKEIVYTGRLLKKSGWRVRSVYIGGGTPTTLSAQQLSMLMQTVTDNIDLSECLEYTVEAGRPDTITQEKLTVLKQHGVTRISINPQSMIDRVLENCGRPHTAQTVVDMYRLSQTLGFTDINMDLIAGLPGDSFDGFRESLEQLLLLAPSNITVHTLALKKGADLFQNRCTLPEQEEVEKMLTYSREALKNAHYAPYYLYRQKYMSGSFENVGYSRDGRDCLYNIYMMEELHPIISLGGGAMSKVNLPNGKLERFHNPKFPEQYIAQFDDVLRQKDTLFSLLTG